MANYVDIGGVPISGFISPGTTSDTFPVIDTTLGIDGLRQVLVAGEYFTSWRCSTIHEYDLRNHHKSRPAERSGAFSRSF